MNRIYPSWEQIDELKVPLTPGERTLAQFLDQNLPQTWSIYVQPYLNDMRPDVVVLSPNHGVVVFEVKDWNLDNYRFENNRMVGNTSTAFWYEDDPVRKVTMYAKKFYEQFLVSDEAQIESGSRPNDCAMCRGKVYFHTATMLQAKKLYAQRTGGIGDGAIVVSSDLSAVNISNIVPYAKQPGANFLR